MSDRIVVDASAMVELLIDSELAPPIAARMRDREPHAPAHFDAEILSAIGRMHRAGEVSEERAEACLDRLSSTPITRHLLPTLIAGAWRRRGRLRLVDALYVELAYQIDAVVVTVDAGVAAADPRAELVSRI